MSVPTAAHRWLRVAVVLLAGTLAGCGESRATDPDSLSIGLLLPFTGTDSATSSNFERAAYYARDRVNAGGGVKGHALRIVSADTHSDPERAQESALELVREGVSMVIGPESPEIASAIRPILDRHDVILLSPVVGAADDQDADCTTPWFRLAPSSGRLGEGLAKVALADGNTRVAVLHSQGEYDTALADAFEARLQAPGGEVVSSAMLRRDAESYATAIEEVLAADADAVLLAASPRSAALVVNEFGILSRKPTQWYLSPLLKTDLLLQNVARDALEGAIGVTPKIFDKSDAFPEAFARRWQGDEPLEGAYFYYDAVVLSAFALEKAASQQTHVPPDALTEALLDVAQIPGAQSGWNEVEHFLPRLRSGDDVYYSGLIGPLVMMSCGDRVDGASSEWSIHDGRIIDAQ